MSDDAKLDEVNEANKIVEAAEADDSDKAIKSDEANDANEVNDVTELDEAVDANERYCKVRCIKLFELAVHPQNTMPLLQKLRYQST